VRNQISLACAAGTLFGLHANFDRQTEAVNLALTINVMLSNDFFSEGHQEGLTVAQSGPRTSRHNGIME
jgi:hypothetical protein